MESGNKTKDQSIQENSVESHLGEQTVKSPIKIYFSPFRSLIIILSSIFVAEAIIMFLFSILPPLSQHVQIFVDVLLLIVLVLPMSYLFLFRPMVLHIDELKRAEKVVRRANEFAEAVFNSMNDSISIIDPYNYRIVDANQVFLEKLGMKKDEVVGKRCYEVTHHRPELCTPPDDICPLEDSIKNGKHSIAEHLHYGKDGETVYMEVTTSPIKNENGEIFQVIHVARDITERKRAEEALRKSEERYRTLFEESRDAVYITTQEGEILDANESMLDLFGYSKEEMIGFNARETYVHSEDRLKFQQMIEREGFVKDYEIKLRKRDGTEMECLFTAIMRRTADGNIAGYQGTIHDITERNRAEEEREKLIGELKEALAKVKTLSGLIPICASCKKIRDDRGYWNQIESYIHEHSDADFSHGICPDCFKKLYPDLPYLEDL